MSYLVIQESPIPINTLTDVRNAMKFAERAMFDDSLTLPERVLKRTLEILKTGAQNFREKLDDIKRGFLNIPKSQTKFYHKLYIKLMDCLERFETWLKSHFEISII